MSIPLFSIDSARVARPRISEVLFERMERGFGSIAELPSNVEALDAGLMFASGHQSYVALVGPSGWGKTHLLECVSIHMFRQFGQPVRIVNALDWIEGRTGADPQAPILIDNAQDAMARTRSRLLLRINLERRVRIGRPTMLAMTNDRLTRRFRSFLPLSREWALHEIGEPTTIERRVIVEQMARTEGLYLAKSLTRLLANRMKGNGNTLHGALNRLKLAGTEWTDPEHIVAAVGILDPFFADNSAWDLKERLKSASTKVALQWPSLSPTELGCYAMLHTAQLSELSVARFCGLPPAKARSQAISFQKSLQKSEEVQIAYAHFVEIAVESLFEN